MATTVDDHHSLWKKIGDHLVSELEAYIGSSYLDSGVKGRGGEEKFRNWLIQWLPQKVKALDGVVVDTLSLPTTQRDVIVFDAHNCPVFRDDSATNILPIEGVLGSIELNNSVAKVEKIKDDIAKIAEIKRLSPQGSPPQYRAFGPVDKDNWNVFREYSTRSVVFGYIFAVDCEVQLNTLATHIANVNRDLGVDASIDGVFILRKGYILHAIDQGWTTVRQNDARLAYLDADPWDVLLSLVATINQHLRLGAMGSSPSLEEYFGPRGGTRTATMLERRRFVEDTIYQAQRSVKFQSMK